MLIVQRPHHLLQTAAAAAAGSGSLEGEIKGCPAKQRQLQQGCGVGESGMGEMAVMCAASKAAAAFNGFGGGGGSTRAYHSAPQGRKSAGAGRPLDVSVGSTAACAEEDFARCDAQNLVIYEVFVRNHSPEGTFRGVEADLRRIKDLGVDVLWLMPHYPIGFEARKGTQGSPYAIMDYRGVNAAYGTMEDFESLVREARRLGLRFMIDIVFNHTAKDSVLAKSHPEWFKRDKFGRPTSPWSDVADLSFHDTDLWEYLFDTLVFWAQKGVNGFRCDVASFVPLPFWKEARRRVQEVDDDVLWMAESCDPNFLMMRRKNGEVGLCDSELYQVFDALYDYDLWFRWCAVLAGAERLQRYLEMLQFQEAYLPTGAVKVRFVENHDQRRIMSRAASRAEALAWTAFAAFNRGAFLMYAGQESAAVKPPELFEKDPIDWADYSLTAFLTNLAKMKKSFAMRNGQFSLLSGEGGIVAIWQQPERESKKNLFGVFNVEGRKEGAIEVALPDGEYIDILSTSDALEFFSRQVEEPVTNGDVEGTHTTQGTPRVVKVEDGKIEFLALGSCMVVEYSGILRKARPMTNTILDFSTGAAVF